MKKERPGKVDLEFPYSVEGTLGMILRSDLEINLPLCFMNPSIKKKKKSKMVFLKMD